LLFCAGYTYRRSTFTVRDGSFTNTPPPTPPSTANPTSPSKGKGSPGKGKGSPSKGKGSDPVNPDDCVDEKWSIKASTSSDGDIDITCSMISYGSVLCDLVDSQSNKSGNDACCTCKNRPPAVLCPTDSSALIGKEGKGTSTKSSKGGSNRYFRG